MPDPLLYTKAMAAAAVVSAVVVLAIAFVRKNTTSLRAAHLFGLAFGLGVGYYILSFRPTWPPLSGLDRFLTVVVPSALFVELLAAVRRVPRNVVWILRASLAAAIPRILLHGSVYLSGADDEWSSRQALVAMAAAGALLFGVWSLLSWLSVRSPGVSIPLSAALALQCAGATIMMAGYLKGGSAAFPFVAAIIGTSVAVKLICSRGGTTTNIDTQALIGLSVVGLFGLLVIGKFFGRLSTPSALTMMLAPLLCWVTEIPMLRNRKPLVVGSFCLFLVAMPLFVVYVLAKQDFDRKLAPLISQRTKWTDEIP